MRNFRARRSKSVAAAILAAAALSVAVGPGNQEAAAAAQPPAKGLRIITLVTGDRLTVLGDRDDQFSVRPGAGREHMAFHTVRYGGHVHVTPADAAPLVASGRLDRRLFDVTALLADGYDRRPELPLIVSADSAGAAMAQRSLRSGGARVVADLPAIGGVAIRVKPDSTFWASIKDEPAGARALDAGIGRIWLDGWRKPILDRSVAQIGAPAAWAAGYDGTGVTVAVLDSGVDANHPDLADRVVARHNFTEGTEDDRDLVGHGTHVASTVAGSGAASDGRYRGAAPGAKLLDGKVCVTRGCADSWIIGGMQWAAEQGAKVVNVSLGGPDTPGLDPVEQAVEALTAEYGTLFVIAAGNTGRTDRVASPGTADSALTVGAVDRSDELAAFSLQGPRVGDAGLKPDLTAPGVDIVAARSADGFLGEAGQAYLTLSGTSMATPHVAGAAAILAQQHPDWGPARWKAALMGSAEPHPTLSPYAQGAGRGDVARAVGQRITADPPGVSLGLARFPHDNAPINRTVTYHNSGTTPVTLALTVRTTGANLFSVDPSTVTVPAGGHAAVTLTTDTRTAPAGHAGGHLVATGGDVVVRTPFAIDVEGPTYDLQFVHTGRNGTGTDRYDTTLISTDGNAAYTVPIDPSGRATARIPAGTYMVMSFVEGGTPDAPDHSMLVYPKLTVDRDQTVEVDARRAAPIAITVPHRDAVPHTSEITTMCFLASARTSFGGALAVEGDAPIFTARIGPAGPLSNIDSQVRTQLAVGGERTPSYHLAWYLADTIPTGFQKRVKPKDLATVRSTLAAHGEETDGLFTTIPVGRHDMPGGYAGYGAKMPYTITQYLNTDGNVGWSTYFTEIDWATFTFLTDVVRPPVTYRGGRTYEEPWNRTVFGPNFTRTGPARNGNSIFVSKDAYFADAFGNPGQPDLTMGREALFRDGVEIPATGLGWYDVPDTPGRYRLEFEGERGAPALFSTRVAGVWNFDSGPVPGSQPVRLNAFTVNFHLPVNDHNTVATRAPVIPVTVGRPAGSPAGTLRELTVEYSTDDGATWRSAHVVRHPTGSSTIRLEHPAGPGFMSLRTRAADTIGSTVELTLIRAYRFA